MNGSRGVGANSSDKGAPFSLRFYSINLCLPGVGVCGDDQGTADKAATGTGRADAEEAESFVDWSLRSVSCSVYVASWAGMRASFLSLLYRVFGSGSLVVVELCFLTVYTHQPRR